MAGGKSKKMRADKKPTRVPELVIVQRDPVASRLTCPLCEDIFEEATTIALCLHTFCRKCIVEKLQDEENCPVCKVHLGAAPSDKLRPDHNIQALRTKLFPPRSTQSDQANASSQSAPNAKPAAETERTQSISPPEGNDSPQKQAQTRRCRKKRGKKGSASAQHGPGPVINEPVVEKEEEEKQEDGIELAPSDQVELLSQAPKEEKEISDKGELVKPLNNLALEAGTEDPTDKSDQSDGTDPDAKGKGVVVPPPVLVRGSKGKGKHKGKKKEMHGAGSSGTTDTVPGILAGTVAGELTTQAGRRFTAVWFSLVAFHDPNQALTLPQISPSILRIKEGNMTVSYLQKYLAQKLGLSNESEVEIMCQNLSVSPAVTMYNLVELWLQTRPKQKMKATIGKSAEKFVMVLHYRRAKMN